MTINRTRNINKRLVGTPATATGGSPGNGGQIGPNKTPYQCKTIGTNVATSILGQNAFGVGACPGVFRSTESFCGTKVGCNCPCTSFGGNLICKASSVAWIVAPSSSEVSRNWYARNDANTTAQQVSGCTGWFVPTVGQLQNPGFTCRTYWDSYSADFYWSSTEFDSGSAWRVSMGTGICQRHPPTPNKPTTSFVRAFRCVTY